MELEILRALADPTRRAVFERLAAGELSVGALKQGLRRFAASHLPASRPTAQGRPRQRAPRGPQHLLCGQSGRPRSAARLARPLPRLLAGEDRTPQDSSERDGPMSEDARHDEAADKRSIAFECDLPEPPDKVWRALTTPEIVSEWLLPTDLRPEAGAKFGFRDPAAKRADRMRGACGRRRALDPLFAGATPRRAAMGSIRRSPSRSRRPPAGGTHLTIVHEVRHAASARIAPPRWPANDNLRRAMRLAA